ncbi:hypothetical protein [Oceanobacillus polygoni]|uniref:Uncharacterized protein n=1 Tax=Oceanobacillus polygoni TaxID=1235259 RepID=A0A9X0YTT2_9BACI|nr:hypothetical protein [Oceanobacillus polygoni]MBP2078499.1 hypothetical protein [Oceanobacillus polygoni]
MNQTSKKKKSPLIILAVSVLFIAGLADIKYRGLFFRLLPESVQSFLAGIIR